MKSRDSPISITIQVLTYLRAEPGWNLFTRPAEI